MCKNNFLEIIKSKITCLKSTIKFVQIKQIYQSLKPYMIKDYGKLNRNFTFYAQTVHSNFGRLQEQK